MKISFSLIAVALLVSLIALPTSARSFRPAQIPNGPTIGCGLCHVNPGGGGSRTSFGEQVLDTLDGQDADWSALFEGDPDTDNYTSGWELGDPNGDWTIGTAHPTFTPSHPGQTDSTPCGNDTLEGPEICDGVELNSEDCTTQGFDEGDLACGGDCLAYDTSNCSNAGQVCNDAVIEGNEVCDGAELAGETCQTQGFDEGNLACAGDCLSFDTSGCSNTGPECNDAIIEGNEVCDGVELGGETCVTQGFDSGNLACAGDCLSFDTSGCSNTGPECNDAIIEGNEVCDGVELGGETCVTQGFDSGNLACSGNCLSFDTSGCEIDEDSGGGCATAPIAGTGAIWLALVGLWMALGRRRS